jgi:hypothetical protein
MCTPQVLTWALAGWFDWFWSMLSGLGIYPLSTPVLFIFNSRSIVLTPFSNVSFQAFGRNLQKSCSSGSTTQARLLYSARCSIQQMQRDSSFPTLCPSQLQSSQLKQAQPTMHSTHHELKASDSDTFNFPSPFSKKISPLCSHCPPPLLFQFSQSNTDGQLHF